MRAAVVLERVTFAYPEAGRAVLEDVSLSIPSGAFALVTGSTGSGKSTLLRTMNGLVPHFTGGSFAGRAFVEGRNTLEHAPRHLADVVAFVPQDPGASFVVDRVEDELAYAMENLGIEASSMRRRVEETLDLLAIADLRDRSVRELSGGERQRVAVAAALTARPRVLLLDEPTSQLDPQGAEDVLAALQRLVHDLGLTVVVAEHRLERVAGFVDLAVGLPPEGGAPLVGEPRDVVSAVGTGPPVTRLGAAAGWRPVPLTVREARRAAPEVGAPPEERPPRLGDLLVQAVSLSAGYGDGAVLEGVDVTVRAGETIALMGRNGAGKTTLLRCLCGLHRPERGRVSTPAGPPRPGIDVALVPQSPEAVLFKATVAGEIREILRTRPSIEGSELLERFALSSLSEQHPRDLSAGRRLLVAAAAVAATGAPVLLLDEPTRGLDAGAKKLLARALRSHAEAGGAVVFATHDVELAAEIGGRVVMLAAGEVIADGPPGLVLGDSAVFAPQMSRVFGPGWLTVDQVLAAMTGAP